MKFLMISNGVGQIGILLITNFIQNKAVVMGMVLPIKALSLAIRFKKH